MLSESESHLWRSCCDRPVLLLRTADAQVLGTLTSTYLPLVDGTYDGDDE